MAASKMLKMYIYGSGMQSFAIRAQRALGICRPASSAWYHLFQTIEKNKSGPKFRIAIWIFNLRRFRR